MDRPALGAYDQAVSSLPPRPRAPASATPAALELPSWVDRVGAGVWISGPDRLIAHVNDRALELLGRDRGEVFGRPCHEVVEGTDDAGRPYCRERCPLVAGAEHGAALAPVTVRVPCRGDERWLQLVVIPLDLPARGGPWLLHCATDVGRSKRAEAYLEGVLARSADDPCSAPPHLTRREREVLGRLAGGATPERVARELHVSLVTVRNHVQHVLAKLGAHSVPEAVARYLLDPPAADRVAGLASTPPRSGSRSSTPPPADAASAAASSAPRRPARPDASARRRPAS